MKLGSGIGRGLTAAEWAELDRCRCPACRRLGAGGLRQTRIDGFVARATHNLAVLLDEAALIRRHVAAGAFATWAPRRIGSIAMADLIRIALEETQA